MVIWIHMKPREMSFDEESRRDQCQPGLADAGEDDQELHWKAGEDLAQEEMIREIAQSCHDLWRENRREMREMYWGRPLFGELNYTQSFP